MATVTITINGQKIVTRAGLTILEAAKEAGIDIPVLCHHPAVASWGGCRICLVEVARQRTLQPACTFPVSEGLEVWTESEKAVKSRKFVLELLFSERNHYCMYCQMSGDCELQSLAYRYGLDHWTYPRPYEKLPIDATRKYFIMDHNRCILCRRCVRACAEIVANHTLGVRERGAKSMIMADHNVPFGESSCVECGTCLQVCPTGALIDRRSAYGGREKDVVHTQTTCIQCSVGCTLDVVTRHRRLLRVDGVWDAGPSKGLLCVAGRFIPLYDTRRRITHPMVRRDGHLAEASWDEALQIIANKLRHERALGIAAGVTTNEALQAFAALFQKAEGKAGRLEPVLPALGYGKAATLQDVLESDFIIVAGVDPLADHRVVGYFIKRTLDRGARLALVGETDGGLSGFADLSVSDAEVDQVVRVAHQAQKPVLVYGLGLTPALIEGLKPLADKILRLGLEPAPNGRGASAAGLWPVTSMRAEVLYLLLGEANGAETTLSIPRGAFVVVQASYYSPFVEKADVVLPAPIWAERTGHTTNLEGRVFPLTPAVQMPAGVRDDAEVLETLASMLD